jgi:hypothetical protein
MMGEWEEAGRLHGIDSGTGGMDGSSSSAIAVDFNLSVDDVCKWIRDTTSGFLVAGYQLHTIITHL